MSDLELKKWRKLGGATDAQRMQWRAVKTAEAAIYWAAERGDVDRVLRAVHALTQANQQYLKILQSVELEERVAALEELADSNNGQLRRVA